MRTRRASEEGQRRDYGIGRDDRVISNLCAILDDGEFSLQKGTIQYVRSEIEEAERRIVFTITQFFPIST